MQMEQPQRKVYPSDISRKDYEIVREYLEGYRRKTRPKIHDTYDILCGILYILQTETNWRDLPEDFPRWRSVHEYFVQWKLLMIGQTTILEKVLTDIGRANLLPYAHRPRGGRRKK